MDCNQALVDKLPEPDKPFMIEDVPEFLCSLDDGIEAELLISMLESHEIPVMRKSRGAGEYLKIYMGMSFQGADIYVPSKFLSRANEILAATPMPDKGDDSISSDEYVTSLQTENKHRQIKIWLIILFFVPGLIWLLAYAIMLLFRT